MKTYSSNEAFFAEVNALAEQFDQAGISEAALEIRNGLSCLNGLTDGWAMLMESLERVLKNHKHQLSAEQRSELRSLLASVRKTVYRNYPNRLFHGIRGLFFPR